MRGGWNNTTISPTAGSSSDFAFVAVSKNVATGDYVLFTGNQSGNESIIDNGALSTSPRTIGIGNLHYNTANFSGQIAIAETIIFSSSKTLTDLENIYQRSRTRLMNRGLVVL